MRDNTFSKKVFIKTVSDNLKNKYRKTIDDATQQELYQAVSEAVKDVIMDEWIATQRVMDKDDPKVVYYMSMEFLMGRALGNNLINLSAYKEVKEALTEIGVDINAIEDQEPDPALGNGGHGLTCHTRISCIRLWNQIQIWYVQAADFRRLPD